MIEPTMKISIDQLAVSGVIGVESWERNVRQELLLDVRMTVDASAAAAGDALEQSIDYGRVCERLAEAVSDSQFKLIESLATHLLTLIEREFNPLTCELTIHKTGAVPAAKDIRVTARSAR